eukprot:5485120-Amphidinium_carterae.1
MLAIGLSCSRQLLPWRSHRYRLAVPLLWTRQIGSGQAVSVKSQVSTGSVCIMNHLTKACSESFDLCLKWMRGFVLQLAASATAECSMHYSALCMRAKKNDLNRDLMCFKKTR